MASVLRQFFLLPLARLFDAVGLLLDRLRLYRCKRKLLGEATDVFLESLLRGMALSFYLIKDEEYQEHLQNGSGECFRGRYLFETAKRNERIATSVTFQDGTMEVDGSPIRDWDVKVTFTNGAALRRFLFSENQDILNSIGANEVAVDGNLNYLYKFGFMAKDLLRRLDVVLGNG